METPVVDDKMYKNAFDVLKKHFKTHPKTANALRWSKTKYYSFRHPNSPRRNLDIAYFFLQFKYFKEHGCFFTPREN